MVTPDLIDNLLTIMGLSDGEYLVDVRWPIAIALMLLGIYWIELR